jgi:hypothetical protein
VSLVHVRRHDEAEQGVLVVDGLLEGGRFHQAGDVVDGRAADTGFVLLDGPDLGRDPQLDPAEIAVRAIVPFQAGRKRRHEPLEDLGRRDVRRHDDQQAVAAVLPPAAVPERPQREPGHGQRLPADDLLGHAVALVRIEADHIGADDRAILPGQGQRPWRRRAGHQVRGGRGIHWRPLAQPEVDLFLDDLQHGRVGADERGEVRRPHDQGHHRLQGHHGRGADVHLQGGPLPDQLARAAFGDHPLGAVLADPDLGEPAEDDGHVVALVPFPHEPRTRGEHPVMGLGPEEPLLIGVEAVPEIAGRGNAFAGRGSGERRREGGVHGPGRSKVRRRLSPVGQGWALGVRQALTIRRAGVVSPVPAAREANLDLQRPPRERACAPERYLSEEQPVPGTGISRHEVLVRLVPAKSAK